jgi:heme/copper-type cytochrome/quinol oxidase subunit 2
MLLDMLTMFGGVALGLAVGLIFFTCKGALAAREAASRKADAAEPRQLNFQTPATEIMEKIVDLHHDLMFFIIVIVVFVS